MQKLKMFGFYYDLLFKETMTLEYFQMKELILYDEGLVQNNPAFQREETSGELLDKCANPEENIIPAGIIYCYLNETEYLKRCRHRISLGNEMFFDSMLSEIEFEKLCYRELKSAEDKVKVLKKYEVPVLEVDMSNKAEDNATLVYEFIAKFN